MKKTISLILIVLIIFTAVSCKDDSFGHITYTNVEDYGKIFELSELRFSENGLQLFPESVDGLNVTDFYCEWELGSASSAKAEIALSVKYDDEAFEAEISRIVSIGNGEIVSNTENFMYEAYATILGYMNTSYYALVDRSNNTVHYVLLQLIDFGDIDINKNLVPSGYGELGEIENISINIYE